MATAMPDLRLPSQPQSVTAGCKNCEEIVQCRYTAIRPEVEPAKANSWLACPMPNPLHHRHHRQSPNCRTTETSAWQRDCIIGRLVGWLPGLGVPANATSAMDIGTERRRRRRLCLFISFLATSSRHFSALHLTASWAATGYESTGSAWATRGTDEWVNFNQ